MHYGGIRVAAAAAGLTALLLGQLSLPSEASAESTCTGSTLVVCVQVDSVLDGDEQVVTTVTENGTGAAVDLVRFSWDADNDPGTTDQYLLTDHDAAWQMLLRSQRLPDGPGTLRVQAVLTDGRTASTAAAVQVSSSQPLPPVDPFVPRTAGPGQDGRVRLAAVGDGADGSPESQAVTAQIAGLDPDVFAYLGDVYDNGTSSEFDTWYDDPAGYGRFRGITNPAIGNHEYRTDAASPYFAYWGGVPHYYSYDLGGWHLVVLDSTTDFAAATGVASQLVPGSAQYDWLAQDLAAHQGSCTIAYMHHPRYSNVVGVSRDGLAQVWQLLVDQNVTMVLAGHAHTYERWSPLDRTGAAAAGGITQFVVGTGGREIMNPKGSDPRVAAQTSQPAAGALRLDLGPSDAAFSYATTDGTFADSGTVPCRKPPPPRDVTGPTTPAATARATTPTTATVSWSASTDDTGVAGYTVRRAGAVVATVGGGVTSYADTGLRGGTTYTWTVEAFDAATNRSAPSAPVSTTTPYPTVSSRTLLRQLRRAPEHPAGYTPNRFPGWTDADGDRCTTDAEVLLAEAVRAPTVGARCALTGGRWLSPYDGKSRTRSSRLVVDHLVPLAEAWRSGAHSWRKLARRQLANDLGYPSTLVAVTRASAADKAAREPQDWLPRPAYRCAYTAQWVAVKWRWRLAVDPTERRFLARRLSSCGWPKVREPGRAR